jgi:phosphate transport system permease protein
MALAQQDRLSTRAWIKSGEPFIWFNAAAVTLSVVAVISLLLLLAVRGLGHFWPAAIIQADYIVPGSPVVRLLGEDVERESVPVAQLHQAGVKYEGPETIIPRDLFKLGNRDVFGLDFSWFLRPYISNEQLPVTAMVLERREWGNFYGFLRQVKEQDQVVADSATDDAGAWKALQERLVRSEALFEEIHEVEKKQIGSINYRIEQLRLQSRRLELNKAELGAGDRRRGNRKRARRAAGRIPGFAGAAGEALCRGQSRQPHR